MVFHLCPTLRWIGHHPPLGLLVAVFTGDFIWKNFCKCFACELPGHRAASSAICAMSDLPGSTDDIFPLHDTSKHAYMNAEAERTSGRSGLYSTVSVHSPTSHLTYIITVTATRTFSYMTAWSRQQCFSNACYLFTSHDFSLPYCRHYPPRPGKPQATGQINKKQTRVIANFERQKE